MTAFLITLAVAATWLARAWFMPMADCRRCGGAKVNAVTRSYGKGRRYGSCGKCKGSGSRWVLGARTVHKMLGSRKGSR